MTMKPIVFCLLLTLVGGLVSSHGLAAEKTEKAPSAPAPARQPPGVLDDQQRELLRASYQKHRDELSKLDYKVWEAQKELTKAMLASTLDEKAIRDKSWALAKLQVEQNVLRAKILEPLNPTLKPDQREQIENNPWVIYNQMTR